MPTYSYRCDTCGHQFDQFQRFSEDPLTDCPTCDGAVRRVIQPVGVVFKGSGWYINDSRKSSDTEKPKTDSPDKAKPSDTAKKATTDNGSSPKSESTTSKPKSAAPA